MAFVACICMYACISISIPIDIDIYRYLYLYLYLYYACENEIREVPNGGARNCASATPPPPVHRLLFSLSASPPHDEPVQVHDPERQKQIGLIKEQHTLTCTATHTWTAAVADGLRAAQPLAEQAANDEDELHLLFVSTFAAWAEQLGLNVGAPTYGAAGPYLKVARSTPCFVRLLAATGPASCHGRCSHCSVMIGI